MRPERHNIPPLIEQGGDCIINEEVGLTPTRAAVQRGSGRTCKGRFIKNPVSDQISVEINPTNRTPLKCELAILKVSTCLLGRFNL